MLAVLAGVAFVIAFILHWVGSGHVPWDVTGFMLLGLTLLAFHCVFGGGLPSFARRQ